MIKCKFFEFYFYFEFWMNFYFDLTVLLLRFRFRESYSSYPFMSELPIRRWKIFMINFQHQFNREFTAVLWTSVMEATDDEQFYTVLGPPSHSEVETAPLLQIYLLNVNTGKGKSDSFVCS